MIRVLQIVDSMGQGGIQSFIMNAYRRIDRLNVQFDFLLCKTNSTYEEEIRRLGGEIYYVPSRSKGILANRKALQAFFASHQYDIVHMHESSLSYIEPLIIAKRYGVKKRIIHSHSTRVLGSRIHRILHYINGMKIDKIASDYVACGEAAAEWMFGKTRIRDKVEIIYNGIETNRFVYNQSVRDAVRKEKGIENLFVVGHVGRFDPVKNHHFVLQVFKEIVRRKPNSILLLAGSGRLIESVKEEAKNLGIESNVVFLGVVASVERIYQAMDAFLLPSLYEGFPISVIEAEANGLPCFLSNTITKEVNLNDNIFMIGLDQSPSFWAIEVLDNSKRITLDNDLSMKQFDIERTLQSLMELYTENKEDIKQ